jgi:hypothetical protein
VLNSQPKALVAGWFSFEQMGASAGDLLVRDVVCGWLGRAGWSHDVALAWPFVGGVEWRTVDPDEYDAVVFACGPFGNGPPITEFLDRFAGKRLLGVNLTMLESLDRWNPFDLLLERDSSITARPDLAFLAATPRVPVVGLVLIDAQPEYRERDRHEEANAALDRLASSRDLARVQIDTRLDVNQRGLTSAPQIESLIAKMDVILTTRLHGTVLALKNGVPVVAIDSVAGGGKVTRQCEALGWTTVFRVEHCSDQALVSALDYCLSPSARQAARACRERAAAVLTSVESLFIDHVTEFTRYPAKTS